MLFRSGDGGALAFFQFASAHGAKGGVLSFGGIIEFRLERDHTMMITSHGASLLVIALSCICRPKGGVDAETEELVDGDP